MRHVVAAPAAFLVFFSAASVAQAQEARPFREMGKYGVRNAGQVTIPPRFDIATLSETGLIITQRAGKIGFVNRFGREIIPLKYDSVSLPRFGLYMVRAGGKHCVVDANGRETLPCAYDSLSIVSPSQLRVSQNGRSFMIARNGKPIQATAGHASPAAANAGPGAGVRPGVPARHSAAPASPVAAAPRIAIRNPDPVISERVRALAGARQWDNAIRAALAGTAHDKAYVLLMFRNSSINDMQRGPAQQVILSNMRIFDDAWRVAKPDQQRLLQDMRKAYAEHARSQGFSTTAAPSASPSSRPSFTSNQHRPYQPSQQRQMQDFSRSLDRKIRGAVR